MNTFTKPFLLFSCLLALLFTAQEAGASHIKAGEITVQRILSDPSRLYNYKFTLNLYVDSLSDPSRVPVFPAILYFGDGASQSQEAAVSTTQIGNSSTRYVIEFFHNFSGPSPESGYKVYFKEPNRVASIRNMDLSFFTSFYLETRVLVSPFLGTNSTPILTIPPIDVANDGQIYFHNPGAYDVDGDSIAYRLDVPKLDRDLNVNGYRSPDDPAFEGRKEDGSGPATFSMNPITGDLIWDAPKYAEGLTNLYNVAFVVEEWRDGLLISETFRDMQIGVRKDPNERPEIRVPPRVCAIAGSQIADTVVATDPNIGDLVNVTAYGGPFLVTNNKAVFLYDNPLYKQPPGLGLFTWNTLCEHIQNADYFVYFKVVDQPVAGKPLATIRTWQIKVIGPPPTGLQAIPDEQVMRLSWDAYACAEADSMTVYRKVGCDSLVQDSCMTDLPAGYELLGVVPIGTTSFNDTSAFPGVVYAYAISASFNDRSLKSYLGYASESVCAELPVTSVFTEVSVLSTGIDTGVVQLRWTQIDTSKFPSFAGYQLYRTDTSGVVYDTLLAEITTAGDTAFADTLLNTFQNTYHYLLRIKSDSGTGYLDTIGPASTVRLQALPINNGIALTWSAAVPWYNYRYDGRMHYVYRKESPDDDFVLIDSMNVTADTAVYEDRGQWNGVPLDCQKDYIYKVLANGSYYNPVLPDPLLNYSQEDISRPSDSIPPNPPVLFALSHDCNNFTLGTPNSLYWEINPDLPINPCDSLIKEYRLYYAAYAGEVPGLMLTATPDTLYSHLMQNNNAGCYEVTAVDFSDVESERSNRVCIENCTYFELPNVFTPNGDGSNDLFHPIPVPRFVERVEISFYNRWGAQIQTISNNPNIDWSGTNRSGQNVPEGVYFYRADVYFKSLNSNAGPTPYKGWVQLLR